jgi:hypothetical protein
MKARSRRYLSVVRLNVREQPSREDISMPNAVRSSDPDVILFPGFSEDARPPCECSHANRPDSRCGDDATVRVTVECVAEGCDCAAGVYLICDKCLSVWKRQARENRVRLRVRPL